MGEESENAASSAAAPHFARPTAPALAGATSSEGAGLVAPAAAVALSSMIAWRVSPEDAGDMSAKAAGLVRPAIVGPIWTARAAPKLLPAAGDRRASWRSSRFCP